MDLVCFSDGNRIWHSIILIVVSLKCKGRARRPILIFSLAASKSLVGAGEGKKNVEFVYRKVGNKYILFSFGIDGKENTEDDIFPQIKKKNDKVGWIKGE